MVVQKGVHRGRGGRTSSRSASDILRACDEGEAVGLLWMGLVVDLMVGQVLRGRWSGSP